MKMNNDYISEKTLKSSIPLPDYIRQIFKDHIPGIPYRKGESAVLIPLIEKDGEYHILYEQRASGLLHQPGEICFPGGRIEAGESHEQAAIRETEEELCIDRKNITLLASLDAQMGPNGASIWPVVALVENYEGTFSEDEVARVFTVPLSWFAGYEPLRSTAELVTVPREDFPYELIPGGKNYPFRKKEHEMVFYETSEAVIWGVTARITDSFLKSIEEDREHNPASSVSAVSPSLVSYTGRSRKGNLPLADRFGPKTAKKARQFHSSFPEYKETPLVNLRSLAEELGVDSVFVKDESYRFGLNAFKVLGGSYAIGRYIANKLGVDISEMSFEKMTSPKIKEKLGKITFVTATDGNHGRGIAWTANRLLQKSVVYMPEGSAAERLKNIQALGAEATILDVNYDEAVRIAKEGADRNGWVLVQDTAWEGYEEIPGWIMEGYTTMADEAAEALAGIKPTHIFLQAGVGSMAAAVCGYFTSLYGEEDKPIIIIVEPDKADCLYRTAKADDGELHFVTGTMNSIMAGLCCGEPCSIAWDILKEYADYFISMPDYIAANGMRILANPLPGDEKVISGESGAATIGLVTEVLRKPELKALKEKLGLNSSSRILCFSTEGDTDKENYRRIVWDGSYNAE